MSYFEDAELIKVLPQNVIDALLADAGTSIAEQKVLADALCDSYISAGRAQIKTPVAAPIPAALKTASLDICKYRLNSRYGTVKELERREYEDVIRWLKDVSSGAASLGIDPPKASVATARPRFSSNERVFTRSTSRVIG